MSRLDVLTLAAIIGAGGLAQGYMLGHARGVRSTVRALTRAGR